MIDPDWFIYCLAAPVMWLQARSGNSEEIESWEHWRARGFDAHSTLTQADPGFVDATGSDYRLLADSPAAEAGTPATLGPEGIRPGVAHDFFGRDRPNPPSCGAFEVATHQ